MTPYTQELLQQAQASASLTHQQLVELLSLPDEDLPALMQAANQVRLATVGAMVHLRGIIEFSNHCRQMCCYCGLRAGNTTADRYRLTPAQIMDTARAAAEVGYRTLVLQSGEDVGFTPDTIADITAQCKALGIAVTLSCGEQPYEVYKLWRDAGADRYLIKHECADDALYRAMRPGHTLSERLQCQQWLKELGYQLGSGCMIGFTGQTADTLARDLELMKEMEVDMAGMGPFIPHSATPMHYGTQGTVSTTLKVLAVARLYIPWLLLPSTTALASMHPQGRELGLRAGANVIMPNVSPQEFRSLYQIYPGKTSIMGSIADARAEICRIVEQEGFSVAEDLGHSVRLQVQQQLAR